MKLNLKCIIWAGKCEVGYVRRPWDLSPSTCFLRRLAICRRYRRCWLYNSNTYSTMAACNSFGLNSYIVVKSIINRPLCILSYHFWAVQWIYILTPLLCFVLHRSCDIFKSLSFMQPSVIFYCSREKLNFLFIIHLYMYKFGPYLWNSGSAQLRGPVKRIFTVCLQFIIL